MNEKSGWKWATFALIGLLVVMLACCVGAWFGGLVGFNLGRRLSHPIYGYEMPRVVIPEPGAPVPPVPYVPEIPREIPPEAPSPGGPAWLGVAFRMVDEGALIVVVVPESAAEAAGLQVGDVITAVDGRAVTEAHPLDEHIGRYAPGDVVTLTVLRNDRERVIDVRLGTQLESPSTTPMDGF